MQKFLLIYHSPAEAMERFKSMNEEEVKGVMDTWMKWKEECGDAIVDFGNPVGGQHVVTLSEAKEQGDDVTGYGIIQAEDLEGAKALLKNHPSLVDDDGSTVSLYPIVQMEM